MNQNNILKNLTIVLCVYGRSEFSERFLKYMTEIKYSFPILVADGDDSPEIKDLIKQHQELNIKLLPFKQKEKFKDYYLMIVNALNKVDTKYSMLVDNDDFVIKNGLNKLLNFLDNNPDYVSAGTSLLRIQIDNHAIKTYGKNVSFFEKYNHRIEDEPLDNWEDQFKQVILNFQPNFYNVYRTEVLQNVWKEILSLNFSDLTIMELFKICRVPTIGKQKSFDNFFHYVRQSGTGSSSENYDFSSNLVQGDLPNDIRLLSNKISEKVYKEDSRKNKLYNQILENYAQSLNNYLPNIMLRFRFKKLFNFKQKLVRILFSVPIINLVRYWIKDKKILSELKSKNAENSALLEELDELKNFLKS